MVRSSLTDARQWEYLTYAPKGEQCPACLKPIASLEAVRRGQLQRPPRPPVVVHRHVVCPKDSE
jgi:hypothetical protein